MNECKGIVVFPTNCSVMMFWYQAQFIKFAKLGLKLKTISIVVNAPTNLWLIPFLWCHFLDSFLNKLLKKMLRHFSTLHLDFSFPEYLRLLPLPCFHFLIVFSNIWELPRTSVFHFLMSQPRHPASSCFLAICKTIRIQHHNYCQMDQKRILGVETNNMLKATVSGV